MLHKNKQCVDAGTVNCPCRLAEFGECPVCSKLKRVVAGANSNGLKTGSGTSAYTGRDETLCSCDWQGVCIYNEYLQNNCCIKQQRVRNYYKIEKTTWYEKDLVVMRISVPRGLTEKASLPGSFVFLKNPGEKEFFDTPISVLHSDYEGSFIEVAVKVSGPKSQSLMSGMKAGLSMLEVRGIYGNGLLGAEKLLAPGSKKVLCLAKGIGLAPLINYARWADGRDHIDFIIDLEKISRNFADDYLDYCRAASVKYCHLPLDIPWAQQDEYDVIVLSASDYYQQNIYIPDSRKVLSNNCSMCCGEGICGACILVDKNGREHRMCKCSRP